MKKLMCMVLSALLLVGGALAEGVQTRERTVEKDGASAVVVETKFESEGGYSLWYPADQIAYAASGELDCFAPSGEETEENASSYLIVPVEIEPSEADALLAEAVGGYGEDAARVEYPEKTLENGVRVGSVQVEEDGVVYRFYLVRDEAHVLCITATYPVADAETVGAIYEAMTDTIEFAADAAK